MKIVVEEEVGIKRGSELCGRGGICVECADGGGWLVGKRGASEWVVRVEGSCMRAVRHHCGGRTGGWAAPTKPSSPTRAPPSCYLPIREIKKGVSVLPP